MTLTLHSVLLIVAVILALLAALEIPNWASGRLGWLAVACLAAAFLVS